ncbi:glycosyltransferase [Halorubellus salinus]|uniref:glycosyltransferase n=1 Tax=Halorubellus salinus TaxID=755309 RepID=UPI001D089E1E|nr:glycosyltransferase [Halorubellus salinus]
MSQSLGVVLPAYDPAVDTLAAYVDALHDALAPEVVRIELDAPDEATRTALESVDATVHAVDARRGKGAAITAGFEALVDDVDVLAFADADGATPAHSIADVVDAVGDDGVTLAVGSRRHPDADVRSHQTFARRYLGDGFAFLARSLLGIDLYDFQCGAKAITTDGWRDVRAHLYEPGFAWDVELLAVAAAHSLPIREVPVTWEDQPESTVSPVSTAYELGRCLLRSRHRMKELGGSSVHEAIADRRTGRSALVDRRHGDVEEQ